MVRRRGIFILGMIALCWLMRPADASAYGDVLSLRGPEEIPETDNFTLLLATTPREENINRTIVFEVPKGWQVTRAFGVEAGSENMTELARANWMAANFSVEEGRQVIAFADTVGDFDPNAAGVAYFVVVKPASVSATVTSVQLRATIVERIDPESPPEIDKKTKKPKARNTNWRMISPFKDELTFAGVSGKRNAVTVRLIKGWSISRALRLEGSTGANAELRTPSAALTQFFDSSFAIECWFRTTLPKQTILLLARDDGSYLDIATTPLGQLRIANHTPKSAPKTIFSAPSLTADGAWHHLAISRTPAKLDIYLDAVPIGSAEVTPALFHNVTSFLLGAKRSRIDLSIDELRLLRNPYVNAAEFLRTITTNARDTLRDAFALFHFDEYGAYTRSSVPIKLATAENGKPQYVPMLFTLDSEARLEETTSPMQSDRVLLTADFSSVNKVGFTWKATSEIGVKEYDLERRVGSFGGFEKTLAVEAKHSIKAPKRGQSIIYRTMYSASEMLPKLQGDIDLYYRVAVVNLNGTKDYSEPIKLEYGTDRDVFVEQNQPNPFNPTTMIAFRLMKPGIVKLAVYDIIGREITTLVNSKLEAGRHTYSLDATLWPGGIYFYKVKTSKTTVTRKMVLAK